MTTQTLNLSNEALLILAEKEPRTTKEMLYHLRIRLQEAMSEEGRGISGLFITSIEFWFISERKVEKQLQYLLTRGEILRIDAPVTHVNGRKPSGALAQWTTTAYGKRHAAELARVHKVDITV